MIFEIIASTYRLIKLYKIIFFNFVNRCGRFGENVAYIEYIAYKIKLYYLLQKVNKYKE